MENLHIERNELRIKVINGINEIKHDRYLNENHKSLSGISLINTNYTKWLSHQVVKKIFTESNESNERGVLNV